MSRVHKPNDQKNNTKTFSARIDAIGTPIE